MQSGRRAADRKDWPWCDRVRFQVARWWRPLATVVVIAGVAVLIVRVGESEKRETNRDEARKYQRCTQTVSQADAQNNTNKVLRSALLTSRNRMLLQVERTKDPVLRRRYATNARKYARDRERLSLALIPDCRATYPRGFEHSDDFPDLAPAKPPARPDR